MPVLDGIEATRRYRAIEERTINNDNNNNNIDPALHSLYMRQLIIGMMIIHIYA